MFNKYILILLILFCFISYYAFVLPQKDKILFALYKYRDDLTLYVMNHPGMQEGEGYQYLIGMINAEIFLVKSDISFTKFFSSTIEKSVENQMEMERIIGLIKQDEFMYQIFEESYKIFGKYFNRKFKFFLVFVITPLILLLGLTLKILHLFKQYNKRIDSIFNATTNVPEVYKKYVSINKMA